MELSEEKFYIITRDRAGYGRCGQYELSTADGKSHCFFMDDTLGYEYFPIDSKIEECTSKKRMRFALRHHGRAQLTKKTERTPCPYCSAARGRAQIGNGNICCNMCGRQLRKDKKPIEPNVEFL